jgi:hypothetical protein
MSNTDKVLRNNHIHHKEVDVPQLTPQFVRLVETVINIHDFSLPEIMTT